MFSPPKSAPLPRKQYSKHGSPERELYYSRGVKGSATLTRTKSTLKNVKKSSKYPFVKKRPLYSDHYSTRYTMLNPGSKVRIQLLNLDSLRRTDLLGL